MLNVHIICQAGEVSDHYPIEMELSGKRKYF